MWLIRGSWGSLVAGTPGHHTRRTNALPHKKTSEIVQNWCKNRHVERLGLTWHRTEFRSPPPLKTVHIIDVLAGVVWECEGYVLTLPQGGARP